MNMKPNQIKLNSENTFLYMLFLFYFTVILYMYVELEGDMSILYPQLIQFMKMFWIFYLQTKYGRKHSIKFV